MQKWCFNFLQFFLIFCNFKYILPIYIVLVYRYVAMGDAITTIAYNLRMGVSTVWEIILDICTAIWEVLCHIHIHVPSEDEWRKLQQSLKNDRSFLIALVQLMANMSWYNAHLTLDHCSIITSHSSPLYFLAVISADYTFVMVDVGAYGRSNDNGVLNSTTFFKRLKNKTLGIPPSKKLPNDVGDVLAPHLFVEDEAFPLRYDLLGPYSRNELTNDARIFNYRLSQYRRVVENSFGILANSWRLYHRQIYLNPDDVTAVIKATLVLYNILTLPRQWLPGHSPSSYWHLVCIRFWYLQW